MKTFYQLFLNNIHFYERHFELANNILNDDSNSTEYSMNIEKPLFLMIHNTMVLTESGGRFLKEVDDTINKPKEKSQYINILKKYLNIILT